MFELMGAQMLELRGLDGFQRMNVNDAGAKQFASRRDDPVEARDAKGDDGNARLEGEAERGGVEGPEFPGAGAGAFGNRKQSDALGEPLPGFFKKDFRREGLRVEVPGQLGKKSQQGDAERPSVGNEGEFVGEEPH